MDVRDIERTIASLPAATGEMEPQTHVGSNIFLSRSQTGSVRIILNDAEPPSRRLSLRRAVLEEGVSFLSDEAENLQGCVLLEFDPDVDGYAVSKVAEHLCRDGSGTRNGDELIESVESFQSMLEGGSTRGWSWTKIIGTWGELACLERTLGLCQDDGQRLACVSSWKSTGVHCLDFVFEHGDGFAFDCKTTSTTKRDHVISSIDQVSSGTYGDSRLLSVMIRPVSDSEGWSIIELAERIGSSLRGEASRLFQKKVDSLEMDQDICGSHHFMERGSRPMMMFRSSEVPGVSRFVPLPEGVPELSWPVQLTEGGMSEMDLDHLLADILPVTGGDF